MPVFEESFRTGCGRYIQKKDAALLAGEEMKKLAKSVMLICDRTSFSVAGEKVRASLLEAGLSVTIKIHEGNCNDPDGEQYARECHEEGIDGIVGLGGGVIMDQTKLTGHFAGLPVLNIPTSSATCAAFTPLSVRYTKEGRTVGTMHFDVEENGVLADTRILGEQPVRLLLSGVFDALAKYVEICHRFSPDQPVGSYPLGLDYAYSLSERTFRILMGETEGCIEDMTAGLLTDRMEQVFFTAINVTGIISSIARGSNQSALAHEFYEKTRYLYPEISKPYLHGEIVGVGLLLQSLYNETPEFSETLLSIMKKHGMPSSVRELGLPVTDEAREEYVRLILESAVFEFSGEAGREKFKKAMKTFFEM